MFSDVPLSVANAVNTTAWVAGIIGAAVTLISVIAAFWSASIRDRYSDFEITGLKLDASHALLQIAALDNETQQAKLDTAKATERVALAEKAAADAKLALEKLKAPRALSQDQLNEMTAVLKPFAGQIFQVIPYWDNPESVGIANGIANGLIGAGWKLDQPKTWVGLLGVISGIFVNADAGAPEGTTKAAKALALALSKADIKATFVENKNPNPASRINLSVGVKP